MEQISTKYALKYPYGKVYKVYNTINDKVYIGSTVNYYVSNRIGSHRVEYRKWKANKDNKSFSTLYYIFDEVGCENCKCEILEEFPCDNLKELRKREAHYILENKDKAVNKNIPGRNRETYYKDVKYMSQKKYYQKNKEKICEYKREYDKKKSLLKKQQQQQQQ